MLYWITRPLMKAFFRVTFGMLGGFKVRGQENVPATGGVLFCPNHTCDADPAAMFLALSRPAYFMAKAEILQLPIVGPLAQHFRSFPVQRDSADRSALRFAEEKLKAGEAVVIFPEGGGNPENRLQPLHPGALLVALRTRTPVIPVVLENAQRFWKYGDFHPRYSGIPFIVTFGKPLDLSDLYGQKGATEEATRRLSVVLAEMLHQPVPEGKPVPRN
jgi:1-acyl-sn-glycerol-3-phosphate acyltransferase